MEKELRLLNEFEVKKVFLTSKPVKQFCPIGQDWCSFRYEITFTPSRYILDYQVLTKWIADNLNGAENTHESATRKLYDYIYQNIEPLSLEVRSVDLRDGWYCQI